MLRKTIKRLLGEAGTRSLVELLSPAQRCTAAAKGRIFNTWSQYGEDLVLERLLDKKSPGTYVDIGASDPEFLSNTRRFYGRGWSGANCEPNPEKFRKLVRLRPRDLNFNCGVGGDGSPLIFYRMSADTLSTFSAEAAEEYLRQGYKILGKVSVPVIPLRDVLMRVGRPVDFLSVDVEGWEVHVLSTNDWGAYRPALVLVEMMHRADQILAFLESVGYERVWGNHTNVIFRDTSWKR